MTCQGVFREDGLCITKRKRDKFTQFGDNKLLELRFTPTPFSKKPSDTTWCGSIFSAESFSCTFQSKLDFENFLRDTYNDSRYSYCILNCGPSVPYRQLKSMEIKDERIPWNMGWNWKKNHDQNWQPGRLPKIIKIRMSHFLNYYPCDTLPTSRLNMKLLKNSFNDCANS
ncbi:hypothetical protein Bhyg_02887, partial [Pseudolycoriella hygida]